MAYGLKYSLPLLSRDNTQFSLELSFDGYSGPLVQRYLGGPQPVLLRKDKADVIRGTSLEFGIQEQTDFEFDEFYTNSPHKIKAVLKQGATTLWTGFNIPQQYQAPYVPAPGILRLTASDQLGLLKSESFTLTGLQSELAIIIHCLSYTGISIGYSIAINTFEASHAENRSPLAQTYIEASTYEDYNCYEVLEKILNKYESEITQADGRWYITCSADKKSTRMLYSSAGVYETTAAAPDVLDLGQYGSPGTDVWVSGSLVRSFTPGAKKGKVVHDFGRKASLLDNYDFSLFGSGAFNDWTQSGSFILQQRNKDGKTYAFLQGYSGVASDAISQEIPITNVADQDFVFELDFSPLGSSRSTSVSHIMMSVRVLVAFGNGVTNWFLTQDGEWSETLATIEMSVKAGVSTPVWNRLRIITEGLPDDSGALLVTLYRYYFTSTPRRGDVYNGICYSEPLAYFISNGELYPSVLVTFATFDDSTEPGDLGEITIHSADAPDLDNKSQLYRNILRLSDGTPTERWHRLGEVTEYLLIVQLFRILASNNRVARTTLTGIIKGSGIKFNSIIKHTYNNNREFEISECAWDLYEGTFNVTLLEILAWSDESVTLSSESQNEGPNKTISSSGSIVGVGAGTETGSTGGGDPVNVLEALLDVDGAGSGLDADTVDGLHAIEIVNIDIFEDMNDPTGFVDRTSSIIGFTAGTREFVIAPVSASFKVYSRGTAYTKSDTDTIIITTDIGLHFIYFDTDGVLQEGTVPWDINSGNIPIATVYWNGTDGLLSDERHGIQMDGQTHEYLHETRGASYAAGLTGTFATNGSTLDIAAGEWYDEDIEHVNAAAYTQCRVFWRIGSAWNWTAAQNGYFHAVASVPQYNNSGALADVGSNKYSISWVFITNNTTTPIAVIMGQGEYNTQALAEAVLPSALTLGTLPAAEMLLLYKIVWQRNGSVITQKSTADYRRTSGGPITNFTATDHSALSKLDYASAGHTGFAPSDSPVFTGTVTASVIDAGDGSVQSLQLLGGDASGASGTDAGDVIVKAGNAILGDSGSVAGILYLVPGNGYDSNQVPMIRLGNAATTCTLRSINAYGAETNIGISISPKGTGILYLGSMLTVYATSIAVNGDLSFGYYRNAVLQGAPGSVSSPAGFHLTIKGGAAYGSGSPAGGDILIYGGEPYGGGARGDIYFGTKSAGHLKQRTTETYVVYYDPSTGKLSYGPYDATTAPPTTTAAPTTTA